MHICEKEKYKKYNYTVIKNLREAGIYDEVISAMEKNDELQKREIEALNRLYVLKDKWYELLEIGKEKLSTTNPEAEKFLEQLWLSSDNQISKMIDTRKAKENPSPEMQIVLNAFKQIPELIEANEVDKEIRNAELEHLKAVTECKAFYERCRREFLSSDYKNRLDQLADDGIFLYTCIIPIFPIADVSDEDLLDHFFDVELVKYVADETLFTQAGEIVSMKMEDLIAAYYLVEKEFYRSSARNLFSLIEAEHKKGAEAFNGFLKKKKEYKNGKVRSEELNKVLNYPGFDWEKRMWEKIEKYYKKIFVDDSSKVINRNSIMHGDYDGDHAEVTRYDVIKLFTLFVNLRHISNSLCRACEDIEIIISRCI